jgi:competence protein ComEA
VPEGSSRSTVVIWVIAAVLAVLAGVRLVGGGGGSEPPPVSIDGAAGSAPSGSRVEPSGGGERGDVLYVHVAGAVRRPGLLRVASGSRVAVALERAGGPTRRANLMAVNLAARLQDGQQIVVPVAGGSAAGGAGAAGTAQPQVHLSTATVEQLDEIDGIGPTLAERIVEYRDAHGGFRSLQELAEVEGIGEKRLATLRDALQP